jgi:N-acetylglucosaminyl-diphospho-decaprenol L-rhamnosyltransferase
MALVDVVVVAYRSARYLRGAVEPFCTDSDFNVVVVDNDCPERSPQTLDGLAVEIVAMRRNVGFGAGCNAGAARGSADAILFLNPDARMSPADVRLLADRLARDPGLGAVGPRMTDADGLMHLTMRREPRLGSAFGEALLLHRAFPGASWTTEIVRDGYDAEHEAEWLGGAALCVRRSAFERIGGFDERFFMYCEDIDLGKRLRESGCRLLYEPAARAVHLGGGSTPGSLNSVLRAKARITYAALHEHFPRYLAFRLATALAELARMPLAAGQDSLLRERADALLIALTWNPREWLSREAHPAWSGSAVDRR